MVLVSPWVSLEDVALKVGVDKSSIDEVDDDSDGKCDEVF